MEGNSTLGCFIVSRNSTIGADTACSSTLYDTSIEQKTTTYFFPDLNVFVLLPMFCMQSSIPAKKDQNTTQQDDSNMLN